VAPILRATRPRARIKAAAARFADDARADLARHAALNFQVVTGEVLDRIGFDA
jgi:hypothetical protein